MEFKMERAKNGIILIDLDGEKVVFGECSDEKSEHQAFAAFLCYLANNYGPSDSRYSEERIYINVAPGDKSEKMTGCHFCGREYDNIE